MTVLPYRCQMEVCVTSCCYEHLYVVCVHRYSTTTQVEFEEKYASSIFKQHWLSIGAQCSSTRSPPTYLPTTSYVWCILPVRAYERAGACFALLPAATANGRLTAAAPCRTSSTTKTRSDGRQTTQRRTACAFR